MVCAPRSSLGVEVGYCSAPFRLCPQPPGRGLQNAVSSPFSPVTSWEAVAVVTTSMQGKHPQPLGGGGVWGDREPRGPGGPRVPASDSSPSRTLRCCPPLLGLPSAGAGPGSRRRQAVAYLSQAFALTEQIKQVETQNQSVFSEEIRFMLPFLHSG